MVGSNVWNIYIKNTEVIVGDVVAKMHVCACFVRAGPPGPQTEETEEVRKWEIKTTMCMDKSGNQYHI